MMIKSLSRDSVKRGLKMGGRLTPEGYQKLSAMTRDVREDDSAEHWERAGGTTPEQNEARFEKGPA